MLHPFLLECRGIEDVALASGFSVVLCNSDEDLAKEARYIEVFVDERMAGAIVSPASEQASDVTALLDRGIPVVTIDRRLRRQDVDAVLVDNRTGAERATARMLASGCRRVACIAGLQRTTTGQERTDGYRRALAAAGVAFDSELVVDGHFKQEGGHDAMRGLLALPRPPDAVFVANNLMSLGAVEAVREMQVDVPGELAIAMFDDPTWAALVSPPLTTVPDPPTPWAERRRICRGPGSPGAIGPPSRSSSLRPSTSAPARQPGGVHAVNSLAKAEHPGPFPTGDFTSPKTAFHSWCVRSRSR